jgi:rare lipoprotein A
MTARRNSVEGASIFLSVKMALRLLPWNPMPAISRILFRKMFALVSDRDAPVGRRARAHISESVSSATLGAIAIMTISSASVVTGCGQVWSPDFGLRSSNRIHAWRPGPHPIQSEGETIPSARIVKASWYGPGFRGRKTASGERFDPNQMTAASKTLPIGSIVHVTNLKNGRSVIVRINDRGPYVRGRSLDLSHGAAHEIGLTTAGVARVKVTPLPTRSELVTDAMLE